MTIITKTVQSSKEARVDEKSLKTLQTITKYLTAILFSYVVGILINIWQIMAKGSNAPSTALFNITAFIALGAILVPCLQSLKKRKPLSFWIFLVFVGANLLVLFLYRLISGTSLFAVVDIVMYMFVAGAVIELYKLKSNGTLN